MSDPILNSAQASRLFAAIRQIKGAALTQGDVDQVNRALMADIAANAALGRKVGPDGVALVKRFEGCKLKAYPDPGTGGKPWTIGWGAITDEHGAPIQPGTVWTQERADARLVQHLAEFSHGLDLLLGAAPTTQHQYDALASIAYNIGLDIDDDTLAEGLGDSTLLKKHLRGDYAGAAGEFAKWDKAGGRVLPGLTKRRAAEAALYLS